MTEKVKKKKNWVLRIIVLIIVAAIIAAAVMIIKNFRPAAADDNYTVPDEFKTPDYLRSKVMNILVCGVDTDPDYEGRVNAMTDVIIVAQIDLENNSATLFQIPRDTYIGYGEVYTGKINALYNWGHETSAKHEASKPAGINYLVEAINNDFALTIDNYVMVSMDGFCAAVDTLGGVDVTLNDTMTFNIKDLDSNVIDTLVLEPGTHTLDGVTAELFVRYRDYDNADIDRLNVQRFFMAALMNKLLNTSTKDLAKLVMACFEYLETDLTLNEMIQLANEAKQLSTDRINTVTVPGEGVRNYVYEGTLLKNQWVYTAHKEVLAELLNEYMRPYTDDVPASQLGIPEIQNTSTELDVGASTLDNYG